MFKLPDPSFIKMQGEFKLRMCPLLLDPQRMHLPGLFMLKLGQRGHMGFVLVLGEDTVHDGVQFPRYGLHPVRTISFEWLSISRPYCLMLIGIN